MTEAPGPGLGEALPFLHEGSRATLFVRVTAPLTALAILLVSIPLVFPEAAMGFYKLLVAYVVPPAGKETIIPAAVGAGYAPLLTATYIAGIDMTVAWFLAWNWDLATRAPGVGGFVERTMERGRDRLARTPLLDRSAFLGLTVFVFFPFQGSGAVVGIVLGRMIGLPPQRAWVAVMLGALLAAFTWAYGAGAFVAAVDAFGFGLVLQGTIVIISVAALVGLVLRRILRG